MSSKNNKFYRFCKRIFNLIFKRYYNVQIIGKEHIPKDEPIIIAGNHKNLFDPCLVFISTDREIHFLAKKECFDNKKIGWMFKKIGCLPVDRTKVNHKTLKLTLAILKNNGAIGIFPEGTRNKIENLLLPFKPGAIELAQRTNAYIVPFGITGEYKFRSKNLKIEFGQPFKVDNINGRICFECSAFFGLGGALCVYIVAPFLERKIQKITKKTKIIICTILLSLITIDNCHSIKHPNMGEGISIVVEENK